MSDPRCICDEWRAEKCPSHPEREPKAREMFPTPTPGATIPYFTGSDEKCDAEWVAAIAAATAARKTRNEGKGAASSCPDCRPNNPCPTHASRSG